SSWMASTRWTFWRISGPTASTVRLWTVCQSADTCRRTALRFLAAPPMHVTNAEDDSPTSRQATREVGREAGADSAPEAQERSSPPRPAYAVRPQPALLVRSDRRFAPQEQRQLGLDVDVFALVARRHDGVGPGQE